MRVILLGAPGSGKGSIGERIRETFGFPRISTGDLLRDAVQRRTPLGLKAESQMGLGGLVDDETVLALLRERLARPDCRTGHTLDGYPRNLAQALTLDAIAGDGREIVFNLEAREEVIVHRLSSRRVCPSCEAIYNVISRKPRRGGICDRCGSALVQRADDRPEIIPERLKTYHAKTEPLVALYAGRGALHRVDANGSVEEAFAAIRAALEAALGRGGAGDSVT